MNTAALISHVPNPRANRRMEQLAQKGKVTLIYWNKGGESCPVKDIPGVEQREFFLQASRTNTLKRMLPMLSYKKQALEWLKEIGPDAVYAERFDMLYIAWTYWKSRKVKPKIIFEVPDLPHMMADADISAKEKLVSRAVRFLENRIYKDIDALIVTSEKFYTDYYSRWIPKEKAVFIPNSPDLSAFRDYRHDGHTKFTVGFIGVVRYPRQLNMLIEASEKAGVNVLFAGFTEGCPEIRETAETKDNITYFGRYDYDRDIAKLYGACDAVYSVYDSKMKNVGIALPNKLYEAVYCGLPIIVSKGTYLAEIVEKYNVGAAIGSEDTGELTRLLTRLSSDKPFYDGLTASCRKANAVLNDTEKGVAGLYSLIG